jgi:hypothetical protein
MATADEMKRPGRFDHTHIGEVCDNWPGEWPDIIVMRND